MKSPERKHDSNRILVIDDNKAIHEDFKKVLISEAPGAVDLDSLAADLFDEAPASAAAAAQRRSFTIDSAFQGKEGLDKVVAAFDEGRPYSMAFVDVRMPPGWDGVETIGHLWAKDPTLQVVLCTAYSDYDWNSIVQKVDTADRLVILRKPFDNIEVLQLAHALTRKWELHKELQGQMAELEARVDERTRALSVKNDELRQEASRRARAELQLQAMQRLEAVGQLAQGMAHEINTPLAVVTSNLNFLRDSFADVRGLLSSSSSSRDPAAQRAAEAQVDLPFLLAEMPRAFEEALASAERVKAIVRATREFAAPEQAEMAAVDLNQAIINTLAIATNDYAAVASLETDLQALPPIACHVGAVNQVVLGLVANAARAVKHKGAGKGRIQVRSHVDAGGADVVIVVEDDGCGIPEALRAGLFRSGHDSGPALEAAGAVRAGQGLAMAHAVVVEQHGGTIGFDTELGRGTTFRITLPVQGLRAAA